MKTLTEYIERYNEKCPIKFDHDKRFTLFYSPEKGFCEIRVFEEMVIIRAMCGDVHFWRKKAEEIGKFFNLEKAGAILTRKILPYIRLLRFRIDCEEELSNGKKYNCTDKITGQKAEFTPYEELPNGIMAYFAIWRVDAGEDKI